MKKTILIIPKSKRYKKGTRLHGFPRAIRKKLPKTSKKKSGKMPSLEYLQDAYGQFAGSRRKK